MGLAYVYIYINYQFTITNQVNVGKYTNLMDPSWEWTITVKSLEYDHVKILLDLHSVQYLQYDYTPEVQHSPSKMVVRGLRLTYWDGNLQCTKTSQPRLSGKQR